MNAMTAGIAEVNEYVENFHALNFPLQKYSFLNAWNDINARNRLEEILRKGILKTEPKLAEVIINGLNELVAHGLSDTEILTSLRRAFLKEDLKERRDESFKKDEQLRVKRRASQITKLLKCAPESYIDIGCGNGRIAEVLKRWWKLPKESVFGTDVYKRTDKNSTITYLQMEGGKIPLPDSSIKFASILMTLHHEDKPKALIREAYRVLKPGGLLLIREHDATSISDLIFFEVIDTIYFSLFNDLKEVPQPGKYRSAKYWERASECAGFQVLRLLKPEPDNPMEPFHLILKKP